jgi:hypothetical protein
MVRMMRAEAPDDHSKATRELGWEPRPVEESIREAARFWANMKNAKRNGKAASSEQAGIALNFRRPILRVSQVTEVVFIT